MPVDPTATGLDIGAFDGGPSDPVGALFLPGLPDMRHVSVIERFTINILSVIRQMHFARMPANRRFLHTASA